MNIKLDSLNVWHPKKQVAGEPPGAIVYSGNYKDVDVTIEAIIYNRERAERKRVERIEEPFDPETIYWFNLTGLHDVGLIKEVGTLFGVHDMDLEDIVHVSQWSKIEEKNDYLFSIIKMIYLKEQEIIHEHVSIIQKENVIITFQETPGDVFDEVRERIMKNLGRIRNMSSNYLLYSLLDALVDQYFVLINRIGMEFNRAELSVLENVKDTKEQVYYLRKELLNLSNAVMPVKDSIMALRSSKSKYFEQQMEPYYMDLMEHMSQVYDLLSAYKDMTKNLHEMQMANVSNEMNKIMMTLTIFSAIFIPLSFLAGVFGMNFTHIPGLTMPSAFYVFVLVCVVIVIGMLSLFKLKKWY